MSSATTLKTLMSQAAWEPGPEAGAEHPNWRWVVAIAEQMAILSGQGQVPRGKPVVEDSLTILAQTHLAMDAHNHVVNAWHHWLRQEMKEPWKVSEAQQHCYRITKEKPIYVVADSTLVLGKRSNVADKQSQTPMHEMRLALNPAVLFKLWAQPNAHAKHLAEPIATINPQETPHLVVYWSLNDIAVKSPKAAGKPPPRVDIKSFSRLRVMI